MPVGAALEKEKRKKKKRKKKIYPLNFTIWQVFIIFYVVCIILCTEHWEINKLPLQSRNSHCAKKSFTLNFVMENGHFNHLGEKEMGYRRF